MRTQNLRSALFVLAAIGMVAWVVDYSLGAVQGLPVITAVGEAQFPHDMHIEDFELECTECHHETNAADLNLPHKEYFEDFWIDCDSCHGTNGTTEPQSCSNCHHSHLTDIANESLSEKVVIHKNCWSCHDVGSGAEASESCGMCHEEASTSPGSSDG